MKDRLLIKYKDKYIVSKDIFGIDLIDIPITYEEKSEYLNVYSYITLLLNNKLDAKKVMVSYEDGLKMNSVLNPGKYYYSIGDYYLYDLDEQYRTNEDEYFRGLYNNLELPSFLELVSEEEILSRKHKKMKDLSLEEIQEMEQSYNLILDEPTSELLEALKCMKGTKKECDINTNNEALVMYSGGKDSTLSALRMIHEGYNVFLIHCNNGNMEGELQPFYTYFYSLKKQYGNNIRFPEDYVNVDIKESFERNFSKWNDEKNKLLANKELTSEIRCLSCRSAMYERILEIAINDGFYTIAEGARKSQKFMIEQPEMIERFKELASRYKIKALYPVLDITDDKKEIEELLKFNTSSKTWESKCLIGKEAMDKSEKDKKIILKYYDEIILPSMIKRLDNVYKNKHALKPKRR